MKVHKQYQGTSNPLSTIQRQRVALDTGHRNGRIHVRIAGDVAVAGGTTGAIKNLGSLLACVQLALTEGGYDTYRMLPAWVYQIFSSADAAQPLASARLTSTLGAGTYSLYEEFSFPFACRQQIVPRETAYLEANESLPFEVGAMLLPNAALNLTAAGTATVTLNNVTISVTQEFAFDDGPLPLFKPSTDVLEANIAGASSNFAIDFKIAERVSDMVITSMYDDADGATIFASAGNIVNALAFRGTDQGQEIIGPTMVPFASLIAQSREWDGGDVAAQDAFAHIDLMPYGALSDTIIADEFKNLRLYLNCQPYTSGGATNSRVLIGVRTLTRPAPTSNKLMVVPDALLPAWAKRGVA